MRRIMVAVLLALSLVLFVAVTGWANDTPLPEVSLETDTVVSSEDAGQVALNVTLSASSTLTVTTQYATQGQTAIAGEDFLTATGTLTFTPGITLQTAFVNVINDTVPEADETFLFVLHNPVRATLGQYPTATIMITDDSDPYVVLLPLVMNNWPVIPYDPTIDTIDNLDGDGAYVVSWVELPARQADTYTLQEATNASFTSSLRTVCVTSEQSCDVTGRVTGTYYYRAKGQNFLGESNWSNVESAQVLPPGTPTLGSISNEDGDGSYLVEWSEALRATSYTLEEDDNASFSSPTTVYSGASLSWAATGKLAGTHYYRVRATGPTGTGSWSSAQSATVVPPGTPVLNSVSNEDGDGSYTVTWEAVDEATGYELQEDDDSAFSSPQTVYTGPALTWSTSGKLNATYYYRVRATGPTGAGAWSNVENAIVLPPGRPTLNSISNPDGDGSYSVSWSAVTDVTGYELQEDDNSVFSSPTAVYSGADLSWSASGKKADTYYYRVRAVGATGAGAWSNIESAIVLPPGTPTLNSIENSDDDGSYTVSWQAVTDATSYELQEDDSSSFTSPTTRYTGSSLSWPASGKQADTYYYRVRAIGPTGSGSWSVARSVTVNPPGTPVLNSIDNVDGDDEYTVSWSSSTGATGYELQEDDSSAFSSPATVYSGSALSWGATSKALGTYYYRVMATGPTGNSGWSNTRSTEVKPPPMPGTNVVCNQSGSTQICASVSKGSPSQYSTVTVYGRLLVNGVGQSGQTMSTTWHYKSTTSTCSGSTNASGIAQCSRSIGRATKGYRVNIDVEIGGHTVTTWFTPQ